MIFKKTVAWLACAVAAIAPGAFAAIAVGTYAFADSIVTLNVALRL